MTARTRTESIAQVMGELLSEKQQTTRNAGPQTADAVPLAPDIPESTIMPTALHVTTTTNRLALLLATSSLLALGACGGTEGSSQGETRRAASEASPQRTAGTVLRVADTSFVGATLAAGVAEPMQHAMLSTKLMGTVLTVSVHEGDAVRVGQALLQIDARELVAKQAQVAASIADAEAMQQDASVQAARMRALYADSAATRAQYDAASTGLTRATAAVAAARAGGGELEAMRSYATVRAPFTGVVTQRMVDAGAFAAPGAPLLVVDDASSLRITVTVAADLARTIVRGQRLTATIDGVETEGKVEGVVTAGAGNLFTVNVIVPNAGARFRAGSAATIAVPGAVRRGVLVPLAALVRDGDLTGVVVRGTSRDERRWVRLGEAFGGMVEITSGLRAGDEIIIPNVHAPVAKPGA